MLWNILVVCHFLFLIVFHCINTSDFFLHSTAGGQLNFFQFRTVMNNASFTHVKVFIWTHAFFSLRLISRSRVGDS